MTYRSRNALQRTEIAAVLVGIAFLLVLLAIDWYRASRGINDFLQLYAGAKLVGTGLLYSPEAVKRVQMAAAGVWLEGVYYSRLPFYAFLLQPLSWLPYRAAYAVYQGLSLAGILVFLRLYIPRCRELIVYASLCVPLLSVLIAGQDVSFVLLLAGASLLLSERGRDFAAGLLLAFCAIKPHLFLLWPVAALLYRRWRVLAGGAAGGAVILTLSYLAGGRDWPSQYLTLLRNPELHPGSEHMPTLHGLLSSLGIQAASIEFAASLLVAALSIAAMFRVRRYDVAAVLSVAGGLLISYHAYTQDLALLLLLFAVLVPLTSSKPLKLTTAFALLPPLPLLLLTGPPQSALMPACVLAILVCAAVSPQIHGETARAAYASSSGSSLS